MFCTKDRLCTVFGKGLACHLGTMSRSSGARVLPRLRQFPCCFLIEKISQFSEAHAGYAYPALVACAACATRRQLSPAMIVLSLHPWSVRIHKRRLTKNKARKCRILSGCGEKNDLIFFSLFPAAQLPSISILSCTHIQFSASRCLPGPLPVLEHIFNSIFGGYLASANPFSLRGDNCLHLTQNL